MERVMKLCAGSANPALAEGISKCLDIPLVKTRICKFKDGECFIRIEENVRGREVFVIQPACPPVNDNLMELLIMLDALKRASVWKITVVIPYYGYSRQDRKVQPRVPITAKLVADLIETAGAHRVLTIDLHAGQIQGFFNIPVDNLYASPVLLEHIKKKNFSDVVIVSPDAGGAARARAFAKRLRSGLAIIDKRRSKQNEAKAMNIIGNVKDKEAILLDDMIDTAGTLCQAAQALKKAGARRVMACASHGLFSGSAFEKISESDMEEVIVTDTIPFVRDNDPLKQKITVLSVANLLGEAIKRIFKGSSVSELFEEDL